MHTLCRVQLVEMSGNKRPAGKDFDPPPVQPKQMRVEPPMTQQVVGQAPPAPPSQQFVLPVRHPLDTTVGHRTRIIGIPPGILPNVSRQLPPSTFAFPSPASSLSPLGLPVHPPLSAGGLVGIGPNPVTGLPHMRPPHLPIPGFPPGGMASGGHTPHSQSPPAGVIALEPPYIPPDHHVASTAPLALIRPGSPASVGHLTLPPRPLLAAGPLAPPPPYPVHPFHGVGGVSGEEFTCASPSQFLRSPTSIASSSQVSSVEPVKTPSSASSDKPGDTTTTPRQKENHPSVAPPPSTRAVLSRRDHHSVKTRLMKQRRSRLAAVKLRYEVQLKERFFLEGGGNMMDFLQWKKKPNLLREQYLKHHDIDGDAMPTFGQLSPKIALPLSSDVKTTSKLDSEHPLPLEPSLSLADVSGTHKKSSKAPGGGRSQPKSDSSPSSTRIQIPLSTVSPSLQVVSPLHPTPLASTPKSAPPTSTTPSSPLKSLQLPSPRPSTRAQLQTQVSFSSVYETSHEDIVMRARHEAEVMRAITDLRKEGLWSTSRLPKVQEPSRRRTLWDFLLEEMQWLATDFSNERRWKIHAAKKVLEYTSFQQSLCVFNILSLSLSLSLSHTHTHTHTHQGFIYCTCIGMDNIMPVYSPILICTFTFIPS